MVDIASFMKCHFCNNTLSAFKDVEKTGNYKRHYCCYICPKVISPFLDYEVWKQPFHIIMDEKHETEMVQYVYFHKLRLWLHSFIGWSMNEYFCIKNENNKVIIDFNYHLDIRKYSPEELENKIRTWITFS